MQNIDFTKYLTATIGDAPRDCVIKFNNCWLAIEGGGDVGANGKQFLVVYRAMVIKIQDASSGEWTFANPTPTLPGDLGTPWENGWGGPVGQALEEGRIPSGRGGRYFDGIGVAEVELVLKSGTWSINVHRDQIIENSDGYEDPRIFRLAGKIYIHSHRFQPDSLRKIKGPQHTVYDGFPPHRKEHRPCEIRSDTPSLFVKLNELSKGDSGNWTLGVGSFYGTNVTQCMEKNFAFFEDAGHLSAVYGVAPYGRPFTILRSENRIDQLELNDDGSEANISVEEFQPNTGSDGSHRTDSFFKLSSFYNRYFPISSAVAFSSCSPLLKTTDGKWLGVGHIKVSREFIYQYILSLFDDMKEVFCGINGKRLDQLNEDEFHEFVQSTGYCDLVEKRLKSKPYTGLAGFKSFLQNALPISEADLDSAANGKLHVYQFALMNNFFTTPLSEFVLTEMAKPNQTLLRHDSDDWETDNRYHQSASCLNFFYEINEDYELCRFSDAFIVEDKADYHSLQFAVGLSRCENNYLMSYGDGDNRAKLLILPDARFKEMMRHKANTFNPQNFEFNCIPVVQPKKSFCTVL